MNYIVHVRLVFRSNRVDIDANEYMKDHIFELRRKLSFMIDHRSYTHNLSSCEIKA